MGEFDVERFDELYAYVVASVEEVGRELWTDDCIQTVIAFIDFQVVRESGASLTGGTWYKTEFGFRCREWDAANA